MRNFNPRTHEECDDTPCTTSRKRCLFQSTHSRGVRLISYRIPYDRETFQSTHSRGVRRVHRQPRQKPGGFQSTHSRGVRQFEFEFCPKCGRFQSTHSRGVRLHNPITTAVSVIYFNPRTHEECDFGQSVVLGRVKISIHALTRSATIRSGCNRTGWRISIHALTRSATELLSAMRKNIGDFNPRTHEECDSFALSEWCRCK